MGYIDDSNQSEIVFPGQGRFPYHRITADNAVNSVVAKIKEENAELNIAMNPETFFELVDDFEAELNAARQKGQREGFLMPVEAIKGRFAAVSCMVEK